MVIRTFFAFDNDNLIVTSSPNDDIVGNPVINNSDTPNGTIFEYSKGSFNEITINDTGGRRNRFEDDDEQNHVIVDGAGIVANGTEVEAESRILVREINDLGQPIGPTIEIFALSKDGVTSDVWGFGTSENLKDGASYLKIAGSNTGDVRYREFITCFAQDTLIKTPRGDIAVQDIRPGQKVWTQRNGPLPVRWVASTTVSGTGAMAPVCFEAGALGNTRPLLVSQQHRIFIESPALELYFGQAQVLVAAKHLCGLPGINLRPQETVHYTHFMFDSHQIVQSNGALTESFFFAEQSLSTLEDASRKELVALFPDLPNAIETFGETAAPTLTAREARAVMPFLAA